MATATTAMANRAGFGARTELALCELHIDPKGADQLVRMAGKLDEMERELADRARWVGREFARYADAVEEGTVGESTPASSSSVLEVAKIATRYATLLEAFKEMFVLVVGKPWSAAR